MSILPAPETVGIRLPRQLGRNRWWQGDIFFTLSIAVLILVVATAVAGPLVAPYPPNLTDVLAANQSPSLAHLMGTDSLGRDVFSRLLHGARLSLLAPAIVVALSTTLGVTVALLAAWLGGWFEALVDRALNVVFAVPGLLVAIIAVAVFGPGFWPPVLALSLVYTPYVARVVKSAARQERRRPYVESLRLSGLSALQINVRHILRNIQPIVLAQATIGMGSALIEFGGLSFIGLGITAPTAEWGAMVGAGRSELLSGNLNQTIAAGTAIVLTVVAFNLLGDRITHRLRAT